MMKYLGFLCCVVMLSFTSCGGDQTEIDLVFQANYGDEILAYNRTYTQDDGVAFNIDKSDFFISNVRLIADDGSETTLFEYAQVDFENSPGGVRLIPEREVEIQNYESIVFGIGLTPDVNSQTPADFPANDLLSTVNSGSTHYWTAWDSYIFSKQEGNFDSNGDGEPDEGWVVHTGTDDIYEEVTINIDRIINEDDNEIRLALDHEPLFIENGSPIVFGLSHNPADRESFENFFARIVSNVGIAEE